MGAGHSREQLEEYAERHNLDTERDMRDYADSELDEMKHQHENEGKG